MSEFGNETATAAMRLTETSVKSLLELIKFIMTRDERKINKEYKKEQIKQIKEKGNIEEAKAYLNAHRGKVKMQRLVKSGERLIPIGVPLSQKELARFNSFAKIEGLVYSAVSDQKNAEEIKKVRKEIKDIEKRGKSKNGKFSVDNLSNEDKERYQNLSERMETLRNQREKRIIIVRAKDLEIAKDITDRMNTEILLGNVDKELDAILSKGEQNLSNEEKERVADLMKEREKIIKGEYEDFNSQNNSNIIKGYENFSFERAVNKVTERDYGETIYICDRLHPENYIEASSEPKTYMDDNGEVRTFTNTEYKVYKNGIQQKCSEFSHGKFTHYSQRDGENSSTYGDEHWNNMKIEMKEKGGFSDDCLIFGSKEDYESYKTNFQEIKKQVKEPENLKGYEEFKDYAKASEELKQKLKEVKEMPGFETKQALTENLEQQIEICNEMNELQTELAMSDVSEEQEVANEKISHGEEMLEELRTERLQLESIELTESEEIENVSEEKVTLSSDEWENEMKNYEEQDHTNEFEMMKEQEAEIEIGLEELE